jgi:hypothetical protein
MPSLEVADIFRDHGAAWRDTRAGHLSLGQLKVMSAIERCRSAALGGHVLCCEDCAQIQIAYNSCRNRHCPKCQGSAARRWLEDRQADLLPVDYYHLVFTLPAPISDIAYQNKAVIYNLLFQAAAETLLTIAADPKRLGVRLGITAVLHTWGSALTHHPHIHCIVPGGGLSLDGERWVAISNNRLITCDERGVTFKWKDYRAKPRDRYKIMTLATHEFIRRFLIHVLTAGFHRIRHYGLFANHSRVKQVQRLRELLSDDTLDAVVATDTVDDHLPTATYTCQACGAPMMIIETFEKQLPRAPPAHP